VAKVKNAAKTPMLMYFISAKPVHDDVNKIYIELVTGNVQYHSMTAESSAYTSRMHC